jgi:enoyl-CoA hydratase/carnithine racemase
VCLCDVVIASDRAVFGQPETSVGVFPPMASVVWPRHFGYHRALDLILTGRRVSAQEMFDVGLVTRVVPADGFEASVADAVGQYVSMSGAVAAHAKRACRIGAGSDVDASLRQIERLYLDSLMKTTDAKEGLEAFIEKRPPEWSDG